jgi:hypothetical protein
MLTVAFWVQHHLKSDEIKTVYGDVECGLLVKALHLKSDETIMFGGVDLCLLVQHFT